MGTNVSRRSGAMTSRGCTQHRTGIAGFRNVSVCAVRKKTCKRVLSREGPWTMTTHGQDAKVPVRWEQVSGANHLSANRKHSGKKVQESRFQIVISYSVCQIEFHARPLP